MTSPPSPGAGRIGRFRFMDAQRVNLDGFAVEDPTLGLIAFDSPADPQPSLVIEDGEVVELDGTPAAGFDLIDEYIARHGLDLAVAPQAMATPELDLARMLVDPAVALGAGRDQSGQIARHRVGRRAA